LKVIPIALAANLASGAATPAYALRVVRTDGQVFGFTSASRSATIDGQAYDATQGLDISAIASSAGLGVDNLELTTLDDGSLFTHADVVGGVWQGAAFLIFRYSWANPAGGVEYLTAGTVGNVTLRQGSIVAELRGLQQYLQQPVGNVTSKTCRARFADHPRQQGNNRCGLAAADWQADYAVTSASSRRAFESASTGGSTGDLYFAGAGLLVLANGANGATSTADQSPTPSTVTLTGGATLSTAHARFGASSIRVTGGGRASATYGTKLDVATGDFTLEISARLDGTGSNQIIFNRGTGTGFSQVMVFFESSSGRIRARCYSSGSALVVDIPTSGTVAANTWHDIALVRSGSTFTLYLGGASQGTATHAGALFASTAAVTLGAYDTGAAPMAGYIDHVRLTKGTARVITALTAEFEAAGSSSPGDRPDDWYSEGLVTWLTGGNAGRTAKVRNYLQAGYAFTLMTDMPAEIQVGDTFTALAGCRKRLDEDCADKFDNALNFQGEPHAPGVDQLTGAVAR